jgi:hypothetical protein
MPRCTRRYRVRPEPSWAVGSFREFGKWDADSVSGISIYIRSVEMVRVTYLDATRIKRLREAGEPWSAAGSTFKRIFHVLGGLNRCRTCSLSAWIRGLADVSSSYVPKVSASGGGVLLPSVSMIRREVATWRRERMEGTAVVVLSIGLPNRALAAASSFLPSRV